jgi:hypothetical protein
LDVAEWSADEVAKQGGRRAGLLRTYQGKSVEDIQRALRGYERQAALHRQQMSSPETKDLQLDGIEPDRDLV